MNSKIQEFIEQNIELIDQEQWISFWELAVIFFPNNLHVRELAEVLSSAEIDTYTHRELLLLDQIYSVIANLNGSNKNYKLALSQFIGRIPLDRRFGFNLREIQVLLLSKRDTLNCNLYSDKGGWTVVRNN